jgi:glycosyltransferase involved in cell wall biosynthesis
MCFVATIPEVVHTFLRGYIAAAAGKWQVTVVCHPRHAAILADLDVEIVPLSFERKASPFRDLLSLFRLIAFFRRERFDLVHSIMPKTGLLAMLAAQLAGVPNPLHTFTGQVWSNLAGWRRGWLKSMDKLITRGATLVFVDSPSQQQFLVEEGVLHAKQGRVIGEGSICGVDTRRFHPDAAARMAVRKELHIGAEQVVILFVGRLTRDKGIAELLQAFSALVEQGLDGVLLLVGPEEDLKFADIRLMMGAGADKFLRYAGYTSTPERYMGAADIFCLPSHREGFGQVIIEAAACGVPAVATKIYGIVDAVADGETGLLFPPGDQQCMQQALQKLASDTALRGKMGEAARQRVMASFSSEKITLEMMGIYEDLLGAR